MMGLIHLPATLQRVPRFPPLLTEALLLASRHEDSRTTASWLVFIVAFVALLVSGHFFSLCDRIERRTSPMDQSSLSLLNVIGLKFSPSAK
jgi:hypothetical protein